ncbi:right-handed parallel beta-helix repeat-containing protein [Motilibacter rhizosphaerae]|uniref:right-handed parallel beta-helix repeat-containing protein n=1 Tax=Motilibacter rhizosphaerae TaxID=598652 RepID=UPI0013EECD77|nr:right-handed parallel beta-helix repeat-containing protein [Motilibacter rhizosphaerae]
MVLSALPVVAALGLVTPGTAQAATACTPDVGGTGLSAAVVAHAGQTISGRDVDATGCDIGIYVGAGADHVIIRSTTVHDSGFQGIFAEKTSWLKISDSTVTGNGYGTIDPSAPPLPGSGVHSYVGQAFAISVFGVSHATISGNQVYDNGRGGIGVMDNGPFDPGALMSHQNPAAPLVPSSWVKVSDNTTWNNANGCGVVAATQNVGGSLSDITIRGNSIHGIGFQPAGPDIGGIVVAADLPGSTVNGADVSKNTVRDSFEGGLIVNAEAPGSKTIGVRLYDNVLSGNNVGFLEAPNTVGIITNAAPGAMNEGTQIYHNHISGQFWGVWSRGDLPPSLSRNDITVTTGGMPVSLS